MNGVNGNIVGADPQLDVLRDNGGFTPTHALLFGSPARDAGNNLAVTSLTNDQRGFTRIFDGDGNGTDMVDIGAFDPGSSSTASWIRSTRTPATGSTRICRDVVRCGRPSWKPTLAPGEDTIILGSGTFTLTLAGRDEDRRAHRRPGHHR